MIRQPWLPCQGGTTIEVPVKELDWKTAYRATTPELAPVKLAALAGRLASQRRFKVGPTASRHDITVATILTKQRTRAKRQAKATRIYEELADSDSDSPLSGDSSDSSP